MTAVAIKDGWLACDSLWCEGDLRSGNSPKVIRVGDLIVGGSGRLSTILAFQEWAKNISDPAPKISGDDNTSVFVVHADGKIESHSKTGVELSLTGIEATGNFYYLRGAMDAGLNAIEAVGLACKNDTACGYPVYAYRIGVDEDHRFIATVTLDKFVAENF